MGELARSPAMIAGEINTIKEQVRATALNGAVEIGKRLQEAKALVPDGEWIRWLKDNVDYSPRTAQNMMALASEYGDNQAQALARLNYTQAVMLLALPEEERAEFVETHDMDGMSTRELKRQLEALKGEKDEMQLTMDQMIAEKQALEAERDKANAALNSARQVSRGALDAEKRLKSELKTAQDEARQGKEALEQAKAEAQKEKEALEQALKAAPQPVIQQVTPPEVEQELAALRCQAVRSQTEEAMRASYDVVKSCYKRIMEQLDRMGTEDAERERALREAFAKGLRLMADQMEKGAA